MLLVLVVLVDCVIWVVVYLVLPYVEVSLQKVLLLLVVFLVLLLLLLVDVQHEE